MAQVREYINEHNNLHICFSIACRRGHALLQLSHHMHHIGRAADFRLKQKCSVSLRAEDISYIF